MGIYMLQDLKNIGPPPPIFLNTNPSIGKKSDMEQNFLKVDIKIHQGDINREMASIYIPIFNTGLAEA